MSLILDVKKTISASNEYKDNIIFNFLDIMDSYLNIDIYYDLINNLNNKQIDNLYYFIYIKLLKLCKFEENINKLNKLTIYDKYQFNNIIYNYIHYNNDDDLNNKITLSIIIMNLISRFFKS